MGLVARGGGPSGGCSSGGADDEGLSRVMLELEESDGIGGESSGEVPTPRAVIERPAHESIRCKEWAISTRSATSARTTCLKNCLPRLYERGSRMVGENKLPRLIQRLQDTRTTRFEVGWCGGPRSSRGLMEMQSENSAADGYLLSFTLLPIGGSPLASFPPVGHFRKLTYQSVPTERFRTTGADARRPILGGKDSVQRLGARGRGRGSAFT